MLDRELDDMLVQEFPEFFKDRYGDRKKTSMAFGFACGNGWFEILREAAKEITGFNQKLPPEERFIAVQVKEKFGTLRIYVERGNRDTRPYNQEVDWPLIQEVHKITERAENKSSITCEVCGSLAGELTGLVGTDRDGNQRIGGWIRTLCKAHRARNRAVIKLTPMEGYKVV